MGVEVVQRRVNAGHQVLRREWPDPAEVAPRRLYGTEIVKRLGCDRAS